MMRRIAGLLLMTSFAACGSDSGGQSDTSNTPDTSDTADSTPDTSDTSDPDSVDSVDSVDTTQDVPDTAAPTVSWSAPAAASCHSGDAVTVSGTAEHADGRPVYLRGTGPLAPVDLELGLVASGAWSGTFSPPADGTYELSAHIDAFSTDPVAFVVDRVAPTVAFSVPARIDGLSVVDADPAEGYQVAVTVSTVEATSASGQVCLALDGGTPDCKALSEEVAFLVTLSAGNHILSATATDGCGLAAEPVTAQVELAFDNPVSIAGPSGTLLARDDKDPVTPDVFDTTFTVVAERAIAGSAITIACRAGSTGGFATVIVQEIDTIADTYEVDVALDTDVFGHEVECRASLDLPALGTSETVALTLAIPAPAFTFGDIPACVRSDLALAGTASGLDGRVAQVGFQGQSTFEAPVVNGTWSSTVVLGTLADGDYTLTVAATDTFGNALADHDAPTVPVAVDRTAPTVAFTGPLSDVAGDADSAPAQAGMQIDVALTHADNREGGQVCLALDGASLGCRPAAATVTFEDVTIQGGSNRFVVTATDACGNAGASIEQAVFHVTESPVVTITEPSADVTTADTALDFVATVTEPDRTTPLPGLAVRLFAGSTELSAVPVDVGDGTYRFEDVTLSAGVATTFTVHATRPGSTGVSGPRVVTQKDVAPEITITSPTAGALNLASTVCVGTTADCALEVTVQTTFAEDGSQASLEVNCGANNIKHLATITSSAASFPLTLTHGSTCTLVPNVTDLVGQERTGDSVQLIVDRIAPTLTIATPPEILLAQHDIDVSLPGIQTLMRVEVGGIPAGTEVVSELSYTDAGGPATRRLTHTVATTTPDGGVYTATFEDSPGLGRVSWPEGVIAWRLEITDPVGNRTVVNRLVTVDSEASVRITGPTASIPSQCGAGCGANAVCHQDTCWLLWGTNSSRQVVAVVGGLDTTSSNLRVCSDAAALAAAGAPVCASTHPTGGTFRQAQMANAASGINALDVSSTLLAGHHRVVLEVRPHDGGAWVSSHTAATATERERRLFLDLTAPNIASVTSPSDTLAPTGTLNAAEQKTAPRVYDISFTTDEAGQAEVMVNSVVAATRTVTVGATTVAVTLPEGTPQVWVVLTDAAGNKSRLTPALGATTFAPIVDVTPPTLSFSRPNTSPIKAGDNRDVVVASSAEGRTVTVFDGGVQVATAVVTGGVASFPHSTFGLLADGSHTLTAAVSDAAANPSTAASSPATVFVDTTAPTGVIVSPENPTGTTDLADSDPATQGFQMDVDFSTSQGAVSWSLWTADDCNLAFQNCSAPVQRASGAVTNPGGAEPMRKVTLELGSLVTQHKIMLRTVDQVGNIHTAEAGVQVLVQSCAISMRNLPDNGWFNGQSCATPPSCASTEVDIEVTFVGLCGADTLRLFDGETQLGPDRENLGNVESFTLTVQHDVHFQLEARAYAGNEQVGSTGVHPIGVDLSPPVTRLVASNVAGFTTPAQGEDVDYSAEEDLDPNAAGMQLHLAVEVVDDHTVGGAIKSAVAVGSSTVNLVPSNGALPRTLTGASPVTAQLLDVTLATGQDHTITVTAADAAGNTSSSSFTAKVDVVVPAAVVLDEPDADPRGPHVTLTWTSVGDDNQTGPLTGYEVRYSNVPLTEVNWDGACDATAIAGSEAIGQPAAPGSTMSVTFGGPDPRAWSDPCKFEHFFQDATPGTEVALYWGVRGVDELGNRSPLTADVVEAVTRNDIQNGIKKVRFSNTNNAFGAINLSLLSRRGSVIGDINADGIADWATYSANAQALCIFAGRVDQPADLVIDTLTSPTHACLLGTQMGSIFTGSTQTGHFVRPLGDVNGDGVGDFTVSGKITNGASSNASEAYMLIYFGQANALPNLLDPHIKIRGIRALTASTEYIGVCSPGDFDGVGAVKTDDIAFGEPFASKLHVIPGQSSWTAATRIAINLTPTFPTPGGTALIDNGAWTVETTGIWGITATAPAGSPASLGLRCGSAGDVLPTPAGLGTGPKDDLFVQQSGSLDARIFIFPGREWTAGTVEQVTECIAAGCTESPANVVTAEDGRSVRLRQDLDKLCQGFGGALQGGNDLTGDGIPDFLATLPLRSTDQPSSGSCSLPDGKSVFIFDGSKFAGAVGQNLRVGSDGAPLVGEGWTGPNGWALKASVNGQPFAARAIGDFDGVDNANSQPLLDIAIGNRLANTLQVRTNHSSAPYAAGQFPVVDGEVKNPSSAADNTIGEWVDGGVDLTGDGVPDFLTGSRTGEILIIH